MKINLSFQKYLKTIKIMTTFKKILMWAVIIIAAWFLIANILGLIGWLLPILLVIAAIAIIDALIPNSNILGFIGNAISKFISWIQSFFKKG